MLKLTYRTILSKLSLPLWLAILLSATVPVLAAQQHRATSLPAATGPQAQIVEQNHTVAFEQASYDVSESAGSLNVTVVLSEPYTETTTVTVNYSTSDGTATASEDYSSASGQLAFPPNVTTDSFTATILSDDVDETDETFTLSLSAPTNADLGTPSTATVTILDDDMAGFNVSPTSFTITEGGASGSFDISLTSEPLFDVTINLSTDSECNVGSSSVVFTSGNWDSPQTVTVTAVDDTIVDGDQLCQVTTTATSDDGNYGGQPVPDVDVTVQDNDSATVSFVDPNPAGVNETAGSITLTVELSNESRSDVTVDYVTGGGTATAGQDYLSKSGTVTFSNGSTSETIIITILDDDIYEGNENETFNVTLSTPSGATLVTPNQVAVTIIDGDPQPTVQFSSGTYGVDEDAGSATITVTLNVASGANVDVTAATTPTGSTATSGADYTATSTPLTFLPGQTIKTFNVPISGDSLDEPNETVRLVLSGESGATLGTPNAATLTITDDDAPPSVRFSNESYSVGEEDGTRQVTVQLSAASGLTVTVAYATGDGSATAGSDYTTTSGTATFSPGDTIETFDVPIINDDVDEPTESVNLTLSSPSNATPGAFMSATIFIQDDDDAPTVQFSNNNYTVNEGGGSAMITVTLSHPSSGAVLVDYSTVGGGTATPNSDYTPRNNNELAFPAGVITRTFTVPITDDIVDENDETVNLTLSNPQGATLGAPSSSVLTIVDNDGATEIRFASATYSVTESVVTATIDVVRSGLSGFAVSVDYATTPGGSATEDVDYTATSSTLNFGPNETEKSFSVPILADQISEADETVNLLLSNPVFATLGSPSTAVLTIQDSNETPAIQFSQPTYSVDESMLTAEISVTLNVATAQDVTVFYAQQEGTATLGEDYANTGGTFNIPAGQRVGTFTVPLLPDQIDEPDETVLLALTGAEGADLGERTTATLIIVDNDPTPTLSFSLSSLTVGETSGTADLPVRLSAASGRTVTVDYATVNGSAIAGSDYVATSGTLTFSPGQTTRIINVPILESLAGEPNETFEVWLSTPTNATLSTPNRATVTIVDGKLDFFSRFFPVGFYNFAPGEPNDGCSQAYEIMPSHTYFFLPDDEHDYYRFTLEETAHVIIEVTNFVPIEGQAVLYKSAGEFCTSWEGDPINNATPGTDKTIDAGIQTPGEYLIFIVNDGEFNNSEAYRLRVRLD